jgi:branched-chain amino acid transport system substrate-binding protein
MKFRRLSMLVLVTALAMAGSSNGSAQTTGTPYELNAILPLTGAFAFFGAASQKTMSLVADRVNASGGIHGRPVHMVFLDDQSNPQQSVQFANALIAKKVPVVLGPAVTATCAAVAPLVKATGPLMFCISPYIDTSNFVYVTAGTALDNAIVVLRYYQDRGYKRFGMLNSTDASGAALDKAFQDAFALPEFSGLNLIAHEHFGPADQSVAAQMSVIKASGPQVLISWTVGSPFATVIRGMHDSGLEVPLVANGANMTIAQIGQLAAIAPKELDFLTIPAAVKGSAVEPRIAKVQRDLDAMFDKVGLKVDGGYANGYDMTILVMDALRNTPPDPTAAQMQAYFSRLHDFPGANAIYDFRTSQRGSGQNGFELARFDATKNDFEPISKPGGAPL